MATITFKGTEIHTCGDLPDKGMPAPDFLLTDTGLEDCSKADFKREKVLLNIFPSLDTSVCANTVRSFNEKAAELTNTEVLCISMDLPFAQQRFCAANGIDHVQTLSAFRSPRFGEDYGVRIEDGPLKGLLARALVAVDASGNVIYTQQVPEIAQEPNYEEVLNALSGNV